MTASRNLQGIKADGVVYKPLKLNNLLHVVKQFSGSPASDDKPSSKKGSLSVVEQPATALPAAPLDSLFIGDSKLARLMRAFDWSRTAIGSPDSWPDHWRSAVRLCLTSRIPIVMYLGPEFLPLLPAAILYINLASDGLPALALGIAPADPDIMKRPPRDPSESVFSFDVRTFILLGALIECPIFLWIFFSEMANIEVARTQVFLMFVIIELILALNFRSLRYSILEAPPHKWLIIAIVWELALFAVLVQFESVRDAFGITMPTWSDVGFVLAVGLGILLSIEIVKKWLRRRSDTTLAPSSLQSTFARH